MSKSLQYIIGESEISAYSLKLSNLEIKSESFYNGDFAYYVIITVQKNNDKKNISF